MADALIVDEGFEIREKQKRKKPLSKDFDAIINITKLKALNPKWGVGKISKEQTICGSFQNKCAFYVPVKFRS